MKSNNTNSYRSEGGILIHRQAQSCDYQSSLDELTQALDSERGVLLTSSYEYPGRYKRWDIGFCQPPIAISASGPRLTISALNARGELLLPLLYEQLATLDCLSDLTMASSSSSEHSIELDVVASGQDFCEEQRSKQPSVFSVLRSILTLFKHGDEPYLGLYGAFGYDLAFQFESIKQRQKRLHKDRDLLLYLPDKIFVADHYQGASVLYSYDFEAKGCDTRGLERTGNSNPYKPDTHALSCNDHAPGEFATVVTKAIEAFRRGDLFEVVPGRVFFEPCFDPPSQVFKRLKAANPAPYGALMNLGEEEYLVGASPEMYLRVEGQGIETCPIAGTIKRGETAIEDAHQILTLLNSDKERAELTMCTDVDRNDKARICEPGSINVIGNRQIEMYSRLIHTVDHVEGTLAAGYDGLDAFLSHTWAVTVTGAPKRAAMQFIEDEEKSPRHWYGGAMGMLGFNGNINTGLTLRTARIKQGKAEVRAGATLLLDSEPDSEEAETTLKACALLDAIRGTRHSGATDADKAAVTTAKTSRATSKPGKQILMVDHQDSFVHTLASYFRQAGANVTTLRPESARRLLREQSADLVILSPGPRSPADFDLKQTIKLALDKSLPVFGVCLGLQGIVEYFGGSLATMQQAVHGKPATINTQGGELFRGLPKSFRAGRYHSLYAQSIPDSLAVTARSEDGIVMAVEHKRLPVSAVQFHPESILSLEQNIGHRIVENIMRNI